MRITGTITCAEGHRYRIEVTVTQGEAVGEGVTRGRCTGGPTRFSLRAVGVGFESGTASVQGTAQIGNPVTRTVEETIPFSGEVTIEFPNGIMGQVVNAFLAFGLLGDARG